MKWLDRLYIRSALAMFIGILLLEVLIMLVGWGLVVSPLVQRSANDFASLIIRVGQRHAVLSEAERQIFLDDLHVTHHLRLESVDAPLHGKVSWLPYIHFLQTTLGQRLGQPIRIVDRGADYALDLPNTLDRVRVSFHQQRIGTAPALTFGLMVLLILLASLSAALLLARYLSRPLESFLQRTEQIGRGQAPDPLPETGARELRHLAARFNSLAAEIRKLLDDRTVMLAGLSHDLRSPITRALMALELARPQMETELHANMQRALAQLQAMTEQYLEFAVGIRADTGNLMRVDQMVVQVLTMFPAERLLADLPACSFMVAETALRRCVWNLLDNALKYSGEAQVEVRLQCTDDLTVIEILDRGIGIPAEQQEHIFRPFTRLDTARGNTGSGLGLSVVRQICLAQGWQVELVARVGGGMCARLVL